jgi:dolichol-phosphate mannosyltransferase
MTAPPIKRVSIVCPVFNEEGTVPLFYARLVEAVKPLQGQVELEILFVNNRSTDGTEAAVLKLRETDPRVQLLTLSRNFGYQASISAGMFHASGDAILNIDVDCEDPPELIPRFVERWLAGADVAYGIRAQREEFVLMHLSRKLFYRFIRRVSDHDIVLDMAEFFLIDRRVRDEVLATRSTFPFVRGQVGYVGFRREGIAYKRQKRISGQTHYNLLGAFRFGVAGILSSSTAALRTLTYVGWATLALDLVAVVLALAWLPSNPLTVVRWLAFGLGLAVLHLGWLVFAVGLLGIYLARVYKDGMQLPLFIGDQRHSTIPVKRHER